MPDGRAAHYHGPQGECARLAAFGQAGSRSTRCARVRPRGRYQAGFNGGEESTRWERACSLSSEGVSLHGHSSDDYEPPWCFFRHTTTKWSGPSGRGVARRGYNAHKVTRLQLRRVGGSATIEEVNRDDTDDGLAPRLRSH